VALKCAGGSKGSEGDLDVVRCKGKTARSLLLKMKKSFLGLACTAKCLPIC
jgi:hypothetical protein